MQLYIGCSGWSYSAWLGHFYPSGLEGAKYLEYYSHIFDYVEIDSSFYRTPHQLTVSRWGRVTPKGFRFTAKFPKSITHDKRLGLMRVVVLLLVLLVLMSITPPTLAVTTSAATLPVEPDGGSGGQPGEPGGHPTTTTTTTATTTVVSSSSLPLLLLQVQNVIPRTHSFAYHHLLQN